MSFIIFINLISKTNKSHTITTQTT